jgi:hypothetical protein
MLERTIRPVELWLDRSPASFCTICLWALKHRAGQTIGRWGPKSLLGSLSIVTAAAMSARRASTNCRFRNAQERGSFAEFGIAWSAELVVLRRQESTATTDVKVVGSVDRPIAADRLLGSRCGFDRLLAQMSADKATKSTAQWAGERLVLRQRRVGAVRAANFAGKSQ